MLSDEMKFDDFDTPKSANATSQDNFHVKIIFKQGNLFLAQFVEI